MKYRPKGSPRKNNRKPKKMSMNDWLFFTQTDRNNLSPEDKSRMRDIEIEYERYHRENPIAKSWQDVLKRKKKKKSTVNQAGNYTKPGMRKRMFQRIKAGGKGGAPGQWSARKAQMLAQRYKKAGGGYRN